MIQNVGNAASKGGDVKIEAMALALGDKSLFRNQLIFENQHVADGTRSKLRKICYV